MRTILSRVFKNVFQRPDLFPGTAPSFLIRCPQARIDMTRLAAKIEAHSIVKSTSEPQTFLVEGGDSIPMEMLDGADDQIEFLDQNLPDDPKLLAAVEKFKIDSAKWEEEKAKFLEEHREEQLFQKLLSPDSLPVSGSPKRGFHTSTHKAVSSAEMIEKIRKPRIPMIKFRKGGPFVQAGATDSGAAAEEVQTGSVVSKSEALEWWMTPERFKRREIDELECEIINMGGRDKPFE